jgi:hypothetical protein
MVFNLFREELQDLFAAIQSKKFKFKTSFLIFRSFKEKDDCSEEGDGE